MMWCDVETGMAFRASNDNDIPCRKRSYPDFKLKTERNRFV